MADKKRLHVVKQGDEWALKREGSGRASGLFDTKAEAVKSGAAIARGEKGQLIIHKEKGPIQEERTYRKDPFPPPG